MTKQILNATGRRLVFSDGRRVIGLAADIEDCCCDTWVPGCTTCIAWDPASAYDTSWSGISGGVILIGSSDPDPNTGWYCRSPQPIAIFDATGIYPNKAAFRNQQVSKRRVKFDNSIYRKQTLSLTSHLAVATISGTAWSFGAVLNSVSQVNVTHISQSWINSGAREILITGAGDVTTVTVPVSSASVDIVMEFEVGDSLLALPCKDEIRAVRRRVWINGIVQYDTTVSVVISGSAAACQGIVTLSHSGLGSIPPTVAELAHWGVTSFIAPNVTLALL